MGVEITENLPRHQAAFLRRHLAAATTPEEE
jgi:hypothetical protein